MREVTPSFPRTRESSVVAVKSLGPRLRGDEGIVRLDRTSISWMATS
jgi:hypothetical protein